MFPDVVVLLCFSVGMLSRTICQFWRTRTVQYGVPVRPGK